MIIVKLNGGLGNQLFQYALGRVLSLKNKTDLFIDNRDYSYQRIHSGYQLGNFNIQAKEAQEINLKPYQVIDTRNIPFVWKLTRRLKPNHIFERGHTFNPDILKLNDNKYLDGFWQDEQYFKDYENIIKSDLSFKNSAQGLNKKILAEINQVNAVCIHVRRGDYVTNKLAQKLLGTQPLKYYEDAIKVINEKVVNPVFYVFSDDIAWSRKNLNFKYPVKYIDNNRENPTEDLRLMSNCKYFIIANSTFSWWGAWLSSYKDKIVIAPKNWFTDEERNINNLVPAGWLKI
jgi:hypothetical protein